MSAEPTPQYADHPRITALVAAWLSALAEAEPAPAITPEWPARLTPIARDLIARLDDSIMLPEVAWTSGSALADLCGPHPRALGAISAATIACLGALPGFAAQLPALLGYLATGFITSRANTFIRGRTSQNDRQQPNSPPAPLSGVSEIPSVLWITDRELRPISIDGGMATLLAPLLHGQAVLQHASELDEAIPIEAIRKAHLRAYAGTPTQFRVLISGHIYQGWVKPLHDHDGTVSGCAGVALDISLKLPVAPPSDDKGPWYQELVETIDGVVWEADLEDSRYTYVSPRAVTLLGYPLDRWLTEKNFWFETTHPDDAAKIREELTRSGEIKPTYQIEYRARAADGRWVWLCNGFTVIREEGQPIRARGVIMDVTAYKETEQALRESEGRFRAVFDSAGIGIALLDADGDLTLSNTPLQRMLGRGAAELHGRSLTALSHPDDMWISRPLFDALVRGERDSFRQEKRYLHKNGQIV